MSKQAKIIRFLNTGIFNATICFSVGFSFDEIRKHLKDDWNLAISKDKELIEQGKYFALQRKLERIKTGQLVQYYFIIFTEPFLFTDESYIILAHEVLHICQFLLPEIMDRNREYECEAYLHSHIMRQCLEEIRGARKIALSLKSK